MIFVTIMCNTIGSNKIFNLFIICFLIVFNGILGAIGYYKAHLAEEEIILEKSLENLELLNSKLRKEKHDAINHIQIINGLIELDEYKEAKEYIGELFESIEEVNNTAKSNIGSLDALLASRYKSLKEIGIDLNVEIQCPMNVSRLSDGEICLLIKDLINNFEISFNRPFKGYIRIKAYIDSYYEELIIEISSNGNKIPKVLNNPMPIEKVSREYRKTKRKGYDFEKIWMCLYYVDGRIKYDFKNEKNVIKVFIPLIKKEA